MEAGRCHEADSDFGRPTVVRAYAVTSIAVFIVVIALTGWAISAAQQSASVTEWAGSALIVLVAAWFVAIIVKERVELDGQRVRIIRLLSVDDCERSEIIAVHRAGGRGKPAFVLLEDARETSSGSSDLTAALRRQRSTSAIAVPGLIFPTQLAKALNVPCRSWSGNSLDNAPPVTFRKLSSREGLLTWLLTLMLVLLIGTMVVGIVLSF